MRPLFSTSHARVLRSSRTHVLAAALLMLLAIAGVGCEPTTTPGDGLNTTRVRVGDMQVVVQQTVAQLANSDWLAARDREADRIVIGVERVENRSSDVITRGEQWFLMQSIASEVVKSGLGRAKNLSMVIPAERLAAANRRGSFGDDATLAAADRKVTHSMTAAIESITRTNASAGSDTSSGPGREDFYSCVYRVVDLVSGELVWEDRVEFSRVALGRSFN